MLAQWPIKQAVGIALYVCKGEAAHDVSVERPDRWW
jgi:hypothetical protein